MSTQGSREASGKPLSTADLAAAAHRPNTVGEANADPVSNRERMPPAADRKNEIMSQSLDATETQPRPLCRTSEPAVSTDDETLEPLFSPELAETYRSRWSAIQSGFVDDPRRAVRSGDELVAQVMTNLANSFAEERHRVEAQLDDSGDSSTENLRVALRRYRSFFERLLSL
jgi:hypothetical protein